jgi:ElaB/YqjD/DUF883 family membrane-anchored ribosome-binding protein
MCKSGTSALTRKKAPRFKERKKIMQKDKQQTIETCRLSEDGRTLLAAAGVVEEKSRDVRKRFADALESSRLLYGGLRDKTVRGVKAADDAWREHPYRTIGIAVGVGAIIGYILSRPNDRASDRPVI